MDDKNNELTLADMQRDLDLTDRDIELLRAITTAMKAFIHVQDEDRSSLKSDLFKWEGLQASALLLRTRIVVEMEKWTLK
jgi:hypothetical protein